MTIANNTAQREDTAWSVARGLRLRREAERRMPPVQQAMPLDAKPAIEVLLIRHSALLPDEADVRAAIRGTGVPRMRHPQGWALPLSRVDDAVSFLEHKLGRAVALIEMPR